VKPVEGGPEGLIAVLQGALGPEGTLVMPSSSATRPFSSTPSALTKSVMKPGRVSPNDP
jgi:aminoglycoside N3'-acetyltransferase